MKTIKKVSKLVSSEIFTSASLSKSESLNDVESESESETDYSEEEEKDNFFKCVPIIFLCDSCTFNCFLVVFSLSVLF